MFLRGPEQCSSGAFWMGLHKELSLPAKSSASTALSLPALTCTNDWQALSTGRAFDSSALGSCYAASNPIALLLPLQPLTRSDSDPTGSGEAAAHLMGRGTAEDSELELLHWQPGRTGARRSSMPPCGSPRDVTVQFNVDADNLKASRPRPSPPSSTPKSKRPADTGVSSCDPAPARTSASAAANLAGRIIGYTEDAAAAPPVT